MISIYEESKFNKIFGFIVFFGFACFALISCIVFCHVPKENQQSANMALAFAMSAFTGLSGYLIGASPEKKQSAPAQPANTTTVQATLSTTEPEIKS